MTTTPNSEKEAREMARKMCEDHFGPEKKPFKNVPWDFNRNDLFIDDAQDEIMKYLSENNIRHSIQEKFPISFMIHK